MVGFHRVKHGVLIAMVLLTACDGASVTDAGSRDAAMSARDASMTRLDGGRRDGDVRRDGGGLPDDAAIVAGTITIDGRRLLIDGVPYEIRGVCWHPVPRGSNPPPDYDGFADEDIALMRAAGINTVRTYAPIRDRSVLDRLAAAGIRVIETVYAYGGANIDEGLDVVREEMDHPAILMWALGNEWNYNGLYTGVPFAEARARLEDLAAQIQALDPDHPVATIHGEVPSAETLAAMPSIDVWGLNVYRGIGFGDLFDVWSARSGAPMFLSEYGADAFDARIPGENVAAQADATDALTRAWIDDSTARHVDGRLLGGTIFEWSDEWWKDGGGSNNAHDEGGIAPGGGPHPDATFNEEWWGIVDIDRNPRPAYDTLEALFTAE